MHRLLIPAALAMMTAAMPAVAADDGIRYPDDYPAVSRAHNFLCQGRKADASYEARTACDFLIGVLMTEQAQIWARESAIERLKHYVPHPDERPIGCSPGARMTARDGCQ